MLPCETFEDSEADWAGGDWEGAGEQGTGGRKEAGWAGVPWCRGGGQTQQLVEVGDVQSSQSQPVPKSHGPSQPLPEPES